MLSRLLLMFCVMSMLVGLGSRGWASADPAEYVYDSIAHETDRDAAGKTTGNWRAFLSIEITHFYMHHPHGTVTASRGGLVFKPNEEGSSPTDVVEEFVRLPGHVSPAVATEAIARAKEMDNARRTEAETYRRNATAESEKIDRASRGNESEIDDNATDAEVPGATR